MSALRRSLVWSLPLCLTAAACPALAAPSARLIYVREPGTETCVDEEGIRRAVAARLGYDPFFPWAKVTVVAHVRREPGAYRAEVTLVDEAGVSRGVRALSSKGDDCTPLVGALALSISLALDPLSLIRPSAPPQESVAPSEGPRPPAPPLPPGPPPPDVPVKLPVDPTLAEPLAQPGWHSWVGLAGTASAGAVPQVAFGGLLRGTLERGWLAFALEVAADAPTSAASPSGGGVKAWLAQGTLLACGRLSILMGCGFVSGGPLFATGVVMKPHGATLPYGAAGPRLGLELPLGPRVRLEGFAQFGFALARRALQVDGVDAYRQAVASPSAGIGLSARIF